MQNAPDRDGLGRLQRCRCLPLLPEEAVELVVHPNLNSVDLLPACLDIGALTVRARTGRPMVELIKVVLDKRCPGRRPERPLKTATDCPSRSGLRKLVRKIKRRVMKIPLIVDPCNASLHVGQRLIVKERRAQVSGDAAKPVTPKGERVEFIERIVGSAVKVRAGKIPLKTDNPVARELVIAADLATEQATARVHPRGRRR